MNSRQSIERSLVQAVYTSASWDHGPPKLVTRKTTTTHSRDLPKKQTYGHRQHLRHRTVLLWSTWGHSFRKSVMRFGRALGSLGPWERGGSRRGVRHYKVESAVRLVSYPGGFSMTQRRGVGLREHHVDPLTAASPPDSTYLSCSARAPTYKRTCWWILTDRVCLRLFTAPRTSAGHRDGVPDNHGDAREFWRSMILLQRPCSTRFLEILEVIEQFRISSPSMNLPFARGPRHPRQSPQKKIAVELKFRHAHTLCSSEITHPAKLRRRGTRPRHLDARRGTTPPFPGEPNDFERIRDRWIIQKSGF
jgi:hypothetical protein